MMLINSTCRADLNLPLFEECQYYNERDMGELQKCPEKEYVIKYVDEYSG
jgi:hypothetical protein